MKILVIGSGAREHAICWKVAGDSRVTHLYCAPGNAGIGKIAHIHDAPVPTTLDQCEVLAAWAKSEQIDLTMVGPEAALAAGIVDVFQSHSLRIVGPTRAAAQIESSKAFSKAFMARHHLPTASFETVESVESAHAYIDSRSPTIYPLVIKVDGLAAGKGVVIAQSKARAHTAIDELASLTSQSTIFVIEEFLSGIELSVHALSDGKSICPMVPARDYKHVGDGNMGPMTGGMGAYSPPSIATGELMDTISRTILEPTIAGMAADGIPFSGMLYVGLMITTDGPKIIEFNARFGLPETECILPRLQSSLVDLFDHVVDQTLADASPVWYEEASCGVIIASKGYPGPIETGYGIQGLDTVDEDVLVFHGGTRSTVPFNSRQVENANKPVLTLPFSRLAKAQRLEQSATVAAADPYASTVTTGGRVLTVVALGKDVAAARRRAYQNVERITFTGAFYRHDIAADDGRRPG